MKLLMVDKKLVARNGNLLTTDLSPTGGGGVQNITHLDTIYANESELPLEAENGTCVVVGSNGVYSLWAYYTGITGETVGWKYKYPVRANTIYCVLKKNGLPYNELFRYTMSPPYFIQLSSLLIIHKDIVLPITSSELAIGYTNSIAVEFTNRQPMQNEQARCFATTTDGVVYSLLLTFTGSIVENELSQQFYPFSVTELLVVNKNFDHTKYVTLDTPQTITGEKYFKIGNGEGLENLVMYANDSFIRKPLHIRVGASDTDNIDCENDYTNFWKTTTFLGQTKIDINDSGTPNLLATHDKTTFSKRAIFTGPVDANGLIYAGGQELRFGGDFLNITDNTDRHNTIVHVNKDFVNFERTATFKSAINADGLIYAGGKEIRFPDYVDFKDNTNGHNVIVKITPDFVNFERTATFKQGLNIDTQPTQAQHAVRKDYVDNAIANAIANAITKVLTTEV